MKTRRQIGELKHGREWVEVQGLSPAEWLTPTAERLQVLEFWS